MPRSARTTESASSGIFIYPPTITAAATPPGRRRHRNSMLPGRRRHRIRSRRRPNSRMVRLAQERGAGDGDSPSIVTAGIHECWPPPPALTRSPALSPNLGRTLAPLIPSLVDRNRSMSPLASGGGPPSALAFAAQAARRQPRNRLKNPDFLGQAPPTK